MKSTLIILICLIIYIHSCPSQETEKNQTTMLINTNLTKEELYQILSNADKSKNNTSIEEVETEKISDTESIVKNGKVKIKIKFEFDFNGEENNKKAFIQKVTSIQNEEEKTSYINYLLALGICLVLIGCFSLSLKMKRNNKFILNKYRLKKHYLLKDD